jgi:D-beta-D-heptose 7-phosphate kinase/D-beta-D-heptose 1-phosphate adenosyltransferase
MSAQIRPQEIVPRLLRDYRDLSVWVIGDIMLDEYIAGTVDRISPEAPVPVVRVRDTEKRLGGAANVARQAAVLGAHVQLGGIIGSDSAGDDLLAMCAASGIDTRAVVRSKEWRTTRKLRVIGHSQQLIRLDWEDAYPCASDMAQEFLSRLESVEKLPDVIVLSDYAKGVLTADTLAVLIQASRGKCPVIVDPKQRDFNRYKGAFAITPNLRELQAAANAPLDPADVPSIASAARKLAAAAGSEALIVTMGDRGMLVVPAAGKETLIPAVQREVYDVTGAGDTVIAVLALSIAASASLVESAYVANMAAGISVGQIGTFAVSPDDLRLAVSGHQNAKILSREELKIRAASWRFSGKRVVFTNGCFDILHSGHLSLLKGAASLGDILVLAINSDASIRRLKGPERPLVSQDERAALLSALSCVDAVTIFDEDTPLEAIECVRPQILVKGQDYRLENVVGRAFVESTGGRVELVPLVPEKSTSALVERIRSVRSTV